jgi:hypothetical protein
MIADGHFRRADGVPSIDVLLFVDRKSNQPVEIEFDRMDGVSSRALPDPTKFRVTSVEN